MNRDQARALVSKTLTHAFDKANFRNFTINLLNRVDDSKAFFCNSTYVKDAFKDHVARFERLSTYTSPEGEKLDVLIVHLTNECKLERARTAIRNFVADHLKQRDNKDAALVAFVSPTRRFSYIVGDGESCHTAQTRFLGLLQDTENNPTLARIEDAFSLEAVTKEFFTQYRKLFEDINAALEKLAAKDKIIRDEFQKKHVNSVDFAKKLMGQIVFLYFLQKKGWLGVEKGKYWGTGPHDFLRRLASSKYGSYENFFNDILEPLFYDTLAFDRGHKAWCNRFNCRIPFLDGGLFEPLANYDWRKTDIILPNKLFTNAERTDAGDTGTGVFDVFDRYNFTVNEAHPLEKEVAIDPEMLGKVFENLIEENRRKGLGSYYTPREIVHYMCQESLINYLDTALNTAEESIAPAKPKQTKLFVEPEPEQTGFQTTVRREVVDRADIETFINLGDQYLPYEEAKQSGTIGRDYPKPPKSIEQHARLIDEKLADITVCDPAVGSGAFPVGMMTEIVRARSALTPYFNDVHDRTPYHFKRHAIQNCLYGVDIDPGAVEIAKLRLWLSLVVDEEDVKQIKPLPNLLYKIVTGNSLLGVEKNLFNQQLFCQLEELKPRYFDEPDKDKKDRYKQEIEGTIHELTNGKEAFDFEIYFSEVFHGNGGFDVVIANPPYLGEKGHKDTFRLIAAGPWGARFYKRKMDLFYFFFHLALDLARTNGSVCFITTSYWITADGALNLRSDLKQRATLLQLLNFGDLKLFETAQGQHNMITYMAKNQLGNVARTLITSREGEADPELIKSILSGTDPATAYYQIEQRYLFDGDEKHVRLRPTTLFSTAETGPLINFTKIDNLSCCLSDYAESVFMGVQTGCDVVTGQLLKTAVEKKLIIPSDARRWRIGMGIYVLSNEELDQLRLTSREERDCLKTFYKNSDIMRYYTPRKNERFLIYVDSQTDLKLYPNIKKHLEKFRPLLAAREQAVTDAHNWFWIRGSKRESYFYRPETVVVPYRAATSRFSACSQDIFGAGDLYYIALKRQYSNLVLLGVLNSSLVFYHLRHRGKRKGKVIEYYKNPLERIPLHKRLLEDRKCIADFERIVSKILAVKVRDVEGDVSALEREIDQLVYVLYGLTPDEIKLIGDTALR